MRFSPVCATLRVLWHIRLETFECIYERPHTYGELRIHLGGFCFAFATFLLLPLHSIVR